MNGGRMGAAAAMAALAGSLALGGCESVTTGLYGSAAQEAATTQSQAEAQAADSTTPVRINIDPAADCPQINVPSGMSSYASYAGEPSTFSVRFQARIAEFARECILNPGNTVTIKVGVEGLMLLGEKGVPGTYPAPLRIFIRDRDGNVVASSDKRLSVTVPAGGSQASFRLVEDSLVVPISPEKPLRSYEIIVGFDEKGAAPPRGKKGRAAG
jgi:hypothetical protein